MGREAHWDGRYAASDEELSWYQREPERSLRLVTRFAPELADPIVDVGGGSSVLVDRLLDLGYEHLTVVDVSEAALDRARQRLGDDAARVRWITADVTALGSIDPHRVWHDRAVFHFLVEERDRVAYVELMESAVEPGGHAIIATFAPDGPLECSGLPVRRYDASSLADEIGQGFELVLDEREEHVTPAGVVQPFVYAVLRRVPDAAAPGAQRLVRSTRPTA